MICACGRRPLNPRRIACAECKATQRNAVRAEKAIEARVERQYQAARAAMKRAA